MLQEVEYFDIDSQHHTAIQRGWVLEAKQQGTLAGEQVQHNRSDDEVDCG
jgi:hypothetical protein